MVSSSVQPGGRVSRGQRRPHRPPGQRQEGTLASPSPPPRSALGPNAAAVPNLLPGWGWGVHGWGPDSQVSLGARPGAGLGTKPSEAGPLGFLPRPPGAGRVGGPQAGAMQLTSGSEGVCRGGFQGDHHLGSDFPTRNAAHIAILQPRPRQPQAPPSPSPPGPPHRRRWRWGKDGVGDQRWGPGEPPSSGMPR